MKIYSKYNLFWIKGVKAEVLKLILSSVITFSRKTACRNLSLGPHAGFSLDKEQIVPNISKAERNNVLSRRPVGEHPNSPSGRRTFHLTGSLENVLSHGAGKNDPSRARLDMAGAEMGRSSPPGVIRRSPIARKIGRSSPLGEIGRSPTGRRDRTLFDSAVDM